MKPVPLEKLEALAGMLPKEPPRAQSNYRGSGDAFDLEGWLAGHNIEIRHQAPWQGGQKWVFARCEWNPAHDDKAAYIVQFASGAIAAGCHHNSCQDRGWHDLRDVVEPGWRDWREHQFRGAGGNGAGPGHSNPWPPLLPLPESPPVPTLPERLVPGPLLSWLVDIADRACFPLEFVAIPAMVGMGALVGGQVGIKPTRFDDFLVVPNLWGGIIARPGMMKTNAVEEGLKPLYQMARKAHDRYQAEQSLDAAERIQMKAELEAIEKQIKELAKKPNQAGNKAQLDTLKEQYATKSQELEGTTPKERRYLTQDATVEKLGELLRDNPRGMLLVRDELAGWLRTLDKPGREGDREFYLEAWNGTGSYTVDRIARGTVYIPAHCVSVCGGIQPGKLSHYITEAVDEAQGADGLLQRLQLLVWPDGLGEWHPVDRWPDRGAREAAFEVYQKLDELNLTGLPLDTSGTVPAMRFSEDAQARWDDWRLTLETRLRGHELEATPAFESHLAKYRSLVPSLALLFHLVDVVVGAHPGAVSLEALDMALGWASFLEAHARKVYSAELNPGIDGAHALAEKIKAGAVTDGQTVREVYRHQWSGLRNANQVASALDMLAEHGWVRVEAQDTGGRPADIIRINPAVRG